MLYEALGIDLYSLNCYIVLNDCDDFKHILESRSQDPIKNQFPGQDSRTYNSRQIQFKTRFASTITRLSRTQKSDGGYSPESHHFTSLRPRTSNRYHRNCYRKYIRTFQKPIEHPFSVGMLLVQKTIPVVHFLR